MEGAWIWCHASPGSTPRCSGRFGSPRSGGTTPAARRQVAEHEPDAVAARVATGEKASVTGAAPRAELSLRPG